MSSITNFELTNKDIKTLKEKKINPYKNIDYSKLVVRKPWGYEYLIYQSKDVAVWILYIKKNQLTNCDCKRII